MKEEGAEEMNGAGPPRPRVAIVGAGPAGLMAAIAAAAGGAETLVLERMERPGLKLLASGGGRCNLTNLAPPAEFMARFGRQGRFLQPALAELDAAGLRQFFADRGVPTQAADGFHVFPVAEDARAVLDALLREAARQGVTLRTRCEVRSLEPRPGGGFRLRLAGGTAVAATAVILAAGGCSYPGLGANGSGFELARGLGHTLVPPVPALVPLVTAEEWPRTLTGITFPDVALRIALSRCRQMEWRGALLFTHRGISGPAVLDASGEVAALLAAGEATVPLHISFRPGRTPAAWREELARWRRGQGAKLLRTLLAGELPAAVAEVFAQMAGAAEERVARLTRDQEGRLAEALAATPVTVTATEGFARAMATRGGASLKEVDPRTLESRRVPGLFLAGEVLDVDGPCGGYNLQWAFSSGQLAGRQAAQKKWCAH